MRPHTGSLMLLAAGIVVGTVADRVPVREPLTLGGYRVLAADFHTHSSTWSDSAITPIGLVLEARHQGLDAIAITGHNQLLEGRVGRWFSRYVAGMTVILGQEILSPTHHLLGIGITRVVEWRDDPAVKIAEIHRQGGVAIAAHPLEAFWPAYAPVMDQLDGSEICHPMIFSSDAHQRTFEAFAGRGELAAIGSSDFHGFGRMGACRTYVFARENSAAAILDAIRARRTVVYGPGGKAYGDPELVRLAEDRPELRRVATTDAPVSLMDWMSRLLGLFGLIGLVNARVRH